VGALKKIKALKGAAMPVLQLTTFKKRNARIFK